MTIIGRVEEVASPCLETQAFEAVKKIRNSYDSVALSV